MPARRLHAGDRRRWRLRPPRDVRIGELETSDDLEPTSAGADRKGPQEHRRRRHTTAVNSGELRKQSYRLRDEDVKGSRGSQAHRDDDGVLDDNHGGRR
jgi:hypothetical protein